jgi:hypothetical protein
MKKVSLRKEDPEVNAEEMVRPDLLLVIYKMK